MDVPRFYSILGLQNHTQFLALLGSLAILIGTFVIDITTPRGFAAGVLPYFLGILLTVQIPVRWAPMAYAAAASVLTISGYIITSGFIGWVVLSNRIFLVVIYWVFAHLVCKMARYEELKAAQEAQGRSRELLQLVIDSVPAMIIYVDRDGYFRFANKITAQWYARPLDDIIGRHLGEVMLDGYERLGGFVDRVLGGESLSLEDKISYPDGETRSIHVAFAPHLDREGNVEGYVALIEDVTEQKQNQDQLRQSQRMEAVGQLTGGVAHDFNNLLAVLMGNLELAVMRLPANNDLRPLLGAAMKAAERGAGLTGQLLAFSRRQTLAPEPTDINELIERVLELARRTLGALVQIHFEPQDDLWRANIDGAQLEHVFLNLAINARDAMPDGGILEIKTHNFSYSEDATDPWVALTAGDYVVIEVEDSGTGMSSDVAEKAFEPFFTTKDVGEGSGLGLSMVYGFVKQSGGHIDIQSTPGEGTTVRLFLPRSNADVAVTGGEADLQPEGQGVGETVLIVEDDPHVKQLAVSIVESLGYSALDVSSAEAALEILQGGTSVDLVLSDIVLGRGMNGVVLANHVHEKFPQTKVLLMSGYAAETFARDGDLGDVYDFIAKPFKIADLQDRIRGLLQ